MDSCYTLDPNTYRVCGHVHALRFGESRLLLCDEPVLGRYVTIYMDRPEMLTLCEVEVYGKPVQGNRFLQRG